MKDSKLLHEPSAENTNQACDNVSVVNVAISQEDASNVAQETPAEANWAAQSVIADCQLCKSDRQGLYWCTTCRKYQCAKCKLEHRRDQTYKEHVVTLAEGNIPALEYVINEQRVLKALIVGQLEQVASRLERQQLENHRFRVEMRNYIRNHRTSGVTDNVYISITIHAIVFAVFAALLAVAFAVLSSPLIQTLCSIHVYNADANLARNAHHQNETKAMTNTTEYALKRVEKLSFSDAVKKRWVQIDKQELPDRCRPKSLRVISGQLWCCCWTGGIIVYDSELRINQTIQAGDMSIVYDVAAINNDDVLIAAYNGLFHLKVAYAGTSTLCRLADIDLKAHIALLSKFEPHFVSVMLNYFRTNQYEKT